MLTTAQRILLKRAQTEAGVGDGEYREAIELITGIPGCTSSKDARVTDRHLDNLLSYFEAIFWKKVDAAALQPSRKANAIFRKRGFWASKNPKGNTSRDRWTEQQLIAQIGDREVALMQLGCGLTYFTAIQNKLRGNGALDLVKYLAALDRTLRWKLKPKTSAVDV